MTTDKSSEKLISYGILTNCTQLGSSGIGFGGCGWALETEQNTVIKVTIIGYLMVFIGF